MRKDLLGILFPNMGDGFVRANSEMIRCNWGINDYRSFMDLPDSKHNTDKEN